MAIVTSGVEVRRSNGLTMALFAAKQLGIYAEPISGFADRGVRPVGPSEILAKSGALAALNGVQFDTCTGQNLPPDNAGSYRASRCDTLDWLLYDRVANISSEPRFTSPDHAGITISVVNGMAIALLGPHAAPGADVAVQLWPPLLYGGRNIATPNLNTGAEWRSGVAIMNDGRIAFAVGIVSMWQLAESLRLAGAKDAGYTDGSYSSKLLVAGGSPVGPVEPGSGATGGRRVASWLVARPGTTASSSASAKAVAVGLAAVALGLALVARGTS